MIHIRGIYNMFDQYEDLLNVNCVMEILGIGRNTALKLLKTGEIPAKKVGREWRIIKADLENYMRKYNNSR